MFVFIAGIVGAATPQDIFFVTLNYDKGNVSIQSIVLTKGYFTAPINQPQEGYTLELVSSSKTLYSQRFDFNLRVHFAPPPEWFDEEGNQIYLPNESETMTLKENASLEFILPYFEDAEKILIKDKKGAEITSVRIKEDKSLRNILEKSSFLGSISNLEKTLIIVGVVFLIALIIFLILRKKKKAQESSW